MAKRDYYEVLGVQKGASDAEIKKAFRQAAKTHHPDMNQGDKEAEARFKEVNEAYEVLSDSGKRAQYDQFGHAAFDPASGGGAAGYGGFGGFGGGGFGGFEDIFDAFFGGGSARGSRRSGSARGSDLRYNMTITFEEAAFGVKKEFSVVREENCAECGGSGAKKGTDAKTCPTCGGAGQVRSVQNTAFGSFSSTRPCDACHGEGKIIADPCSACHGKGRINRSRRISVNIPAGVDSDQAVTLAGEGEAGKRGGPPGDLYVYITVKPHKLFKRRNENLYLDMVVPFTTAALGGEIVVPTLKAPVKYNVPEGTQPGTIFRLRDQGIARVRGSGRGDLFVKAVVEVPKKLSERQKELLRELDETLTGESRTEQQEPQKKSFVDKVKDAFSG